MKKLRTIFATIVAIVAAFGMGAVYAEDYPKPTFTADGKLNRPDISYREWVFVGTPLTPNDMNPPEATFPEFHNVYIHPDDFKHWKRTGTFPDGTVLIKELVTVGSKQAVSGNGYFMGEFTGLEATIKDSKRFKNQPGFWAYFTFGHTYPLADTSEAFPAAACNSCHENSAKDDFVFTQYYPVLADAKGPPEARSGRVMDRNDKEHKKISASMAGKMDQAKQSTAKTKSVRSVVPTDDKKLHEWLRKGDYKKWAARESENHPSAGPHTKYGLPVRVFMEPKVAASMKAGNKQHPAGSAIVKEMFDANKVLEGWAVMVKTQAEGDGGKGWYWYEATSTEPGTKAFASGNGVPLCFGCHGGGKDFVLTKFPMQ